MKRIIKIVIATVLLIVAVFMLYLLVIYPLTWNSSTKKESIRILEASQTTNEFAEAVGSLGIFLAFPDESWIAIRYRDSHAGGVFSSAIARDSGGAWFESSHHFCGKFGFYSRMVERQTEMQEELKALGDTNTVDLISGFEDVHRLATSPSLHVARRNLMALDFERIDR